ncbi:8-amino-7-oxononanoate synthase [Rhodococcoides kroppenstedtii]|uniref:8-amino-7-oxononanoate synthase n=1 Tax=Rhodococcoides kroppenstedtii TaxID=293050 RepID=A0A1I0TJV6_9NOCA|nr:aminotransferase class I/II-fold pyridoxal phosphate-dependent enzyme [Rhodococcus kroppenstedtii]SFA52025.1 8-amino-7-oxononanoate synthase [Rhodococcus kroppenstedtii]
MSSQALLDRIRHDKRIWAHRVLTKHDQNPFFRVMKSVNAPVVDVENRSVIMMGSNNYLGLADHPVVRAGAAAALERYDATVTGSRLLNGTITLHTELEEELADWHGTDQALVFTTGYQANLGGISALVGVGDTVVVDSAAHASIYDACRLSRATVRAFRHNRVDLLEDKLSRSTGVVLVVVDGLYSMHGDLAPLDEVAAVCEKYDAALFVDEAHSVAVMGPDLTGAAGLFGAADDIDARMGCLSKGLGSSGGFVAGSKDIVDAMRVHARTFLFTTAGVPAALGAALAAIRLMRTDEGAERSRRTLANARYLHDGLRAAGVDVGAPSPLPDGSDLVSPIVAVNVRDDLKTVNTWRTLWDAGVFASAAMFPAVPHDGAILRLCVQADHTTDHLDRVIEEVGKVLGDGSDHANGQSAPDEVGAALASPVPVGA